MAVNRCVCADIPFTTVLRMHTERGLSLEQIQGETGCGTHCTTCEPYLRLTLLTGRTDPPVLPPGMTPEEAAARSRSV